MKFYWSKLKKPVFCLAPMAEITTLPFRSICKQMGADIVFTPMISSDAVIHNLTHTLKLAQFKNFEQPIIIQIFGYDGKKILKAIQILDKKLHPAGFDINMGCPARKIINNNCGASLIRNINQAIEIVKIIRYNFSGQLSIKTRIGWDKFDILPLLKEFEAIGVNAVIIHGRTVKQEYSGKADWKAINCIAKELKIPVIGNGDIKNWQTAYLRSKGVSGVMIGQGALGNPWIFQEIKKQKDIFISSQELAKIIRKQAKLSIQYLGKTQGIKEFRKHLGWYLKNPKYKELRKQAVLVSDIQDIEKILEQLHKI